MFAYCYNNPITLTDSTGTSTDEEKKTAIGILILLFTSIFTTAIAMGLTGKENASLDEFSVHQDKFGIYHINERISIEGSTFFKVTLRTGNLKAWSKYKNEFDKIIYQYGMESSSILAGVTNRDDLKTSGYNSIMHYISGYSYAYNSLNANNKLLNAIETFQRNPTKYNYLTIID